MQLLCNVLQIIQTHNSMNNLPPSIPKIKRGKLPQIDSDNTINQNFKEESFKSNNNPFHKIDSLSQTLKIKEGVLALDIKLVNQTIERITDLKGFIQHVYLENNESQDISVMELKTLLDKLNEMIPKISLDQKVEDPNQIIKTQCGFKLSVKGTKAFKMGFLKNNIKKF